MCGDCAAILRVTSKGSAIAFEQGDLKLQPWYTTPECGSFWMEAYETGKLGRQCARKRSNGTFYVDYYKN